MRQRTIRKILQTTAPGFWTDNYRLVHRSYMPPAPSTIRVPSAHATGRDAILIPFGRQFVYGDPTTVTVTVINALRELAADAENGEHAIRGDVITAEAAGDVA